MNASDREQLEAIPFGRSQLYQHGVGVVLAGEKKNSGSFLIAIWPSMPSVP